MSGVTGLLPQGHLNLGHGHASVPQINAELEKRLIASFGRCNAPSLDRGPLAFELMVVRRRRQLISPGGLRFSNWTRFSLWSSAVNFQLTN
jgi:hypothetical protein